MYSIGNIINVRVCQSLSRVLFPTLCTVAGQVPLSMEFSKQEYWSGLPFPSPVDHILSELSTMTRPSWVALNSMAHSFVKNWLIGKDPDAGKDWRQEEETTENEMVGWHHRLNEHEFEKALGVGDGQGNLEGYSPWGCKESDMTEWLKWAELIWTDMWNL